MFERFRWRFGVVGVAALSVVSFASAEPTVATSVVAASAPTVEPIYWRQNLFLIPYQWTSTTDPSSADAVWLYVSKDRGAKWEKISEARPQVRAFNYHAEADGEFWFAIRTVDTHGHSWPEGPMQAELKVIVDTTSPRFGELSGTIRDGNALDIHWQVADANLDATSCKVEVQPDGAGAWQPAPLPAFAPTIGGVSDQKTTFQLPSGCRTAAIRAAVYDRAGNRAIYQGNVGSMAMDNLTTGQMPALISGRGDLPTVRPPITTALSTAMSMSESPKPAASPLVPPRIESPSGWVGTSAVAPQKGGEQPALTQSWPADNRVVENHFASFNASRSPSSSAAAPTIQSHSPFAPLEPFRESSATSGPNPEGIGEAPARVPATALAGNPPKTAATNAAWSGGPAARWVDSRTFSLEYQLENIGPEGVSKVELWGTRDNGMTWRSFAIDDDNRSPLQATVDGEGVYGFRIVVDAAGGPGGLAPRPGDRPELVVGVDLSRPQLKLTAADMGGGDQTGRLVLQWQAVDEHLESRPIGLFYSSRPAGPWSTIATSLENTGEYVWQVERHVPARVYLRIEARDLAGNLAAFQTSEPVTIDLPSPTAHPGAVDPLGPTANEPKAGYH